MIKSPIYLLRSTEADDDRLLAQRLAEALEDKDQLSFVAPRDFVAIKSHFGEGGTNGYVRPVYLKALGERVRALGGKPFLTETATLYRHLRSNAVDHLELAYAHGFSFAETRLPIVMADGLLGDEEVRVEVPGIHASSVDVATLFTRCQGLVLVSHFTGHILSGFGAALKNLGMGCTGRKGKLIQHSSTRPKIDATECTGCGECLRQCPTDAIDLTEEGAQIDSRRCIGCGECHAVCRYDAVSISFSASSRELQERMVEHAMGVVQCVGERAVYINVLKRMTRGCDCMASEPLMKDIGILFGKDPVALDAASLDLVEREAHQTIKQMTHPVEARIQLEHARAIGFGTLDYELHPVD